ncbi:MAG: hypothetical protein MRJ65_11915 [Candidatus Brocadiaceae bacterium]|nr:hypothetical protein [Candidatus Brocadiaceae bacterium]
MKEIMKKYYYNGMRVCRMVYDELDLEAFEEDYFDDIFDEEFEDGYFGEDEFDVFAEEESMYDYSMKGVKYEIFHGT